MSKTDIAATAIIDKASTTDAGHILASETAQSKNDDATIAAQNRRDTATAIVDNRNATSTTAAENRQATIDTRGVTATFVAGYKTIAGNELVTYADKHTGEDVKIQGTIFNIIDLQNLQVMLSTGDAIYITLADTQFLDNIYKGDYVTVYGTVGGYVTGTNAFGGTIKQASLIAATVIKS